MARAGSAELAEAQGAGGDHRQPEEKAQLPPGPGGEKERVNPVALFVEGPADRVLQVRETGQDHPDYETRLPPEEKEEGDGQRQLQSDKHRPPPPSPQAVIPAGPAHIHVVKGDMGPERQGEGAHFLESDPGQGVDLEKGQVS